MRIWPFRKVRSIALIGMDGSGKSTQVEFLRKALQAQGQPVRVIHPYGWKLLAFLVRYSGPGQPEGRPPPGRTENRPSLVRRLIGALEILDIGVYLWAQHLGCLLLSVSTPQPVWLLSDRAFDDLLVKHLVRKTLSMRAARWLRRLVPPSDLVIWLRTDPAVARRRNREFSGRYYHQMAACYAAAAGLFHWRVVSTAQKPRETVFREIARLVDFETGPHPRVGPDSSISLEMGGKRARSPGE